MSVQRHPEPDEGRPARSAPFGLDLSMEALDRATRLAKSLFSFSYASIILVHEGDMWRSRYEAELPTQDPVAKAVLASGELFWVEDGLLDPRVANNPLVTGYPFLRFCAAVPIRLADGTISGVLSVSGLKPQRFNPGKAARLRDLADIVANEWSRAQAARSHAKSNAERDAALERSERSEERLNLALALADIHVWDMDFERRELIKAGAAKTFLDDRFDYKDLYRDIFVTIDPRDRPGVEAAWRDHTETGKPFQTEYRVSRNDDGEVWIQGSCKLTTDERGRPQRIIGAMQNISERKKSERALVDAKRTAEAASQTKSNFLATMSHEIRTPLNGVLGMVQAIAADDLAPIQRERLEVVRQSSEALLVVLNDILDITKIEAGKLSLEEIEFDLHEIACNVHANFASLTSEKDISFVLDVAAPPGLYRGDPTRLRQILNNLISNALKFTEAGEVRVAIVHADGRLSMVVADTGIGVPPEGLSSLFDRFTQVDSSSTRRVGGSGLGLAICRELTELMGGSIEVVSESGLGSTFAAVVPLEWVSAAPGLAATPAIEEPADQWNMDTARILAAEDNAINRLVLKTLLLQVGLQPVFVEDGAEALAAWQRQSWDVILMDIQMPVMDGPTAVRAIRAEEAKSGRPRTPILALTANAMTHQAEEYLTAGMDGVISKPIRVEELFAALRAALEASDTKAAA
jgi:signal transduction histidine kinase/ActR/RegA family two-component response regulator